MYDEEPLPKPPWHTHAGRLSENVINRRVNAIADRLKARDRSYVTDSSEPRIRYYDELLATVRYRLQGHVPDEVAESFVKTAIRDYVKKYTPKDWKIDSPELYHRDKLYNRVATSLRFSLHPRKESPEEASDSNIINEFRIVGIQKKIITALQNSLDPATGMPFYENLIALGVAKLPRARESDIESYVDNAIRQWVIADLKPPGVFAQNYISKSESYSAGLIYNDVVSMLEQIRPRRNGMSLQDRGNSR